MLKRICILIIISVSSIFGTDYFVDKVKGKAGNNGTSKDTPFKTVSQVNGVSLAYGDRVFFMSGQTWREKLVVPSISGTPAATNPVVFSRYGATSLLRPVITGFDLLTGTWTTASVTPSTLAEDNCNRNDSNTWGTATTGGAWTYGSGGYDTDGSVCQVTTDWQYGKAHFGASTTANIEAYAEWSNTQNTGRQFGFRIRNNDADDTHYRIFYIRAVDGSYSADTLYLEKVVAGTATILAYTGITDAGASFNIRALVENVVDGVQIRVRYWSGSEDLTDWDIDTVDSENPLLEGKFSVELGNDGSTATNGGAKIDNIIFRTPSANFPNVWKISRAIDPEDVVLDGQNILVKRTSVAEVNANPGSFYYNAGLDLLYVRLKDSLNPNTSKRLVQAPGRDYAIDINSRTYVTLQGLSATGATSKAVNGTGSNQSIRNCIIASSSSGIHLTGASALVQNTIIRNILGDATYALHLAGANSKEIRNTYQNISYIPRKISNTGYIAHSNTMHLKDNQNPAYEVTSGASDTPTLYNNAYYRPTILHGFHQALSGVGNPTDRETRLELARSLGAHISREAIKPTLFWSLDANGNAQYDFSRYQEQVVEYANAGIKVLWTLHNDSPDTLNGYTGSGDCPSYVPGNGSASHADFLTWLNEQVRAYGEWMEAFKDHVEYVEIGNEINEDNFWNTSNTTCQSAHPSTAEQQVSWANAIAAKIKSIKPNINGVPQVKVAFGGITGLGAGVGTYGNGINFLTEVLDHDGVDDVVIENFDAIGIHPYDCDDYMDEGCTAREDKMDDGNFTDIKKAHTVLANNKLLHWEVWATEWGWFQTEWTDQQQQDNAEDALELLREDFPYVTISTYFLDVDQGEYTDSGAFTSAYAPKVLAEVIAKQWSPTVLWKNGTTYSIHKLATTFDVEENYTWDNIP